MIEGFDIQGILHLLNKLLPYGSIYVKNSVATVSIDQDLPDVLVTQWAVDGKSRLCKPDFANSKITIAKKGIYMIVGSFSVNVSAGGPGITIRLEGYLNGVIQPSIHAHRSVSSTDIGSISMSGILEVDTVPCDLDIRANSNSSAARTLTVEDANLLIKGVG